MMTTCKNTNQKCIKSRKYRERMKTELQTLKDLLPRMGFADDGELANEAERKMDSQTVVKVTLSYFKTKSLTQVAPQNVLPEPAWDLFSDSFADGIMFLLSESFSIQYLLGDIQKVLGLNAYELLQTDLQKLLHKDDAAALLRGVYSNQPSFRCTLRFLTMKTSSSYTPLSCSIKSPSVSSQHVRYILVCEPDMQQRLVSIQQRTAVADMFWSEHTLSLATTRSDPALDRMFSRHNVWQNKSLYELVHPAYQKNLEALHRDVIVTVNKRCEPATGGKRVKRSEDEDATSVSESASGSLVELLLEFPVGDSSGRVETVAMRVKSRATLANRNKRQKSVIITHKIVSVSVKPSLGVPYCEPIESWDPFSAVSSPSSSQDVPNRLDVSVSSLPSYNDQNLLSPTLSSSSALDNVLPSIHNIWKSEPTCPTSCDNIKVDFGFLDLHFDLCNV